MIEAAAQSAWSTDRGPADRCRRRRGLARREDHSAGAGGDRARRHRRPRPGTQARGRCAARRRLAKRRSPSSKLLAVDPALERDAVRLAAGTRRARRRRTTSANCSNGCASSATLACSPEPRRGSTMTGCSSSSAKGAISDAHQIGRYAAHRRRAILVANVDRPRSPPDRCGARHGGQADRRLVRARPEGQGAALRRQHAGRRPADAPVPRHDRSPGDGPGGASGTPSRSWTRPSAGPSCCACGARSKSSPISPRKTRCVGAADRYRTLRKFAPELLEALEFKAAREQRPDAGRDQAAAGSQPLRQARRAGGRAHAVPQGVEAAGDRGRTAKPAPVRDRRVRHAARQAALRRRLGRAVVQLSPLRQLPAAAGRGAGDRGRTGIARDRRRMAGQARRRARSAAETLRPPAAARRTRRGRVARRAPACRTGEGGHAAGGRRPGRPDRRDAAARPHHRGAARSQPRDRVRRRLHQPAHRRALRQRERAARRHPGRRHQPRA